MTKMKISIEQAEDILYFVKVENYISDEDFKDIGPRTIYEGFTESFLTIAEETIFPMSLKMIWMNFVLMEAF